MEGRRAHGAQTQGRAWPSSEPATWWRDSRHSKDALWTSRAPPGQPWMKMLNPPQALSLYTLKISLVLVWDQGVHLLATKEQGCSHLSTVSFLTPASAAGSGRVSVSVSLISLLSSPLSSFAAAACETHPGPLRSGGHREDLATS